MRSSAELATQRDAAKLEFHIPHTHHPPTERKNGNLWSERAALRPHQDEAEERSGSKQQKYPSLFLRQQIKDKTVTSDTFTPHRGSTTANNVPSRRRLSFQSVRDDRSAGRKGATWRLGFYQSHVWIFETSFKPLKRASNVCISYCNNQDRNIDFCTLALSYCYRGRRKTRASYRFSATLRSLVGSKNFKDRGNEGRVLLVTLHINTDTDPAVSCGTYRCFSSGRSV